MKDILKWTEGTIMRFSGTGVCGFSGDGGPALKAQLNGPAGIAVDKEDNVYIADFHNNVIRKVDANTKIICTYAGCGEKGFEGDGGLAVMAKLNGPEGVYADAEGNIYIADTFNHRIRKVDSKTGIIHTVAGNGKAGYDGRIRKASEAMLNSPSGVVVDTWGNIYFNDYKNDRVQRVDIKGNISTYAGTGKAGYSGDREAADKAMINDVYGLAIDKENNIYIMDSLNFAVRKVDYQSKIITTVFGKGKPGPVIEFKNADESYIGGAVHEKGSMGLEAAHAVEVDAEGNIYVADTGINRIRMLHRETGKVFTIAGNGEKGYLGDNGPSLKAQINIHGLRMDSKHNLYFNDFHNHVIRVIKLNS